MSNSLDELSIWLEKAKIQERIAQIARAEDRRDGALLAQCFMPESIIDMGVFSGRFSDYITWVVPGDPSLPVTQHTLGQTLVVLDSDSRARAETYVTSYHRVDTGTEHRDTAIGGRYLDVVEKIDGDWKVVERTLLYDWFSDYGQAVDWSQGVMGLPFTAEHYVGRSEVDSDFSDQFFKG